VRPPILSRTYDNSIPVGAGIFDLGHFWVTFCDAYCFRSRPLIAALSLSRPVQRIAVISSRSILGGLHHQYARVWVIGTHTRPERNRVPIIPPAWAIPSPQTRIRFSVHTTLRAPAASTDCLSHHLLHNCRIRRTKPSVQMTGACARIGALSAN
jgi:hypothetical protein